MTIADYVRRLQGSTVRFDLSGYSAELRAIEAHERECDPLTDIEITRRAADLRLRANAGEALHQLRPTLFALAREASRRALAQRPYDEQVLAALAMDDGHIVEMQTGEGKTLAAVMPASLNALVGRGVHVLTFNDYLARRDAEWMAPVYRLLGLSVACVEQRTPFTARHEAYRADITYVTAKEAGFDHLRDLLATDPGAVVHRPFHFALVDEADSLMIDEARVPLVIAGAVDTGASRAPQLASLVASLTSRLHFDSDEYGRDIELTDRGIEHVERVLACGSLHQPANLQLLTELNCALHARVLLRRDVDYIVRDGRIQIVDEFTGRVVTDRHWPDGLQAALEAKEGLDRRPDGRILGSITLQRLLRGYPKLCGMTGTARSAAEELKQVYGRDVTVIPTHRPIRRIDQDDVVYATLHAKERAIVEEVRSAHANRRPVLVGTASVTESERLAARLREVGVACEVLNAKNDAEEARIVAGAGALGAVTISTNMAGRGTDIRLGGADDADHNTVAALGGLYVIGANRHESRRVDLQLRGRAGRQGDPGESRFFVSLEDELLVRFGIKGLIAGRYRPDDSGAPIDNPIVRREVARAQRIVDGQNYEIRKTLGRYTQVVDEQHTRLMERRLAILTRDERPAVWERDRGRRDALAGATSEDTVDDAERLVTLACIDRAWQQHLALIADLREGIHLVRLGGSDPLTTFTSEAIRAFTRIDDEIDTAVLDALSRLTVQGNRLDLESVGVRGPSSTWTYLVNDDPFRNRIGALLTGPGGPTLAMYAAGVLGPLLVLWGLVERFWRRNRRARR
jgi:preprotein translocase subunit SecA